MNFFRPARLAFLSTALMVTASAVAQEPDGAQLFARYCASCHGPRGEGDGPVASAMLVSVPNLRALRNRANGTFPRDAVMRYIDGRDLPAAHGERLMPVWGSTFAESENDSGAGDELARQRIEAITEFIAGLQN